MISANDAKGCLLAENLYHYCKSEVLLLHAALELARPFVQERES